MSSDNEFEDPYNISSEEVVGPLEVENTDTYPRRRRRAPRGRRRWWYVRGERVCRRSAGGGGAFEVDVSAGGLLEVCQRHCELDCSSALHRKGWLLEVCQRSAGGRPEVYRVREPTTTTNARREVLFTHCGLKVHSHYSV